MNGSDLHWALGMVGSLCLVLSGVVVFLARVSFRLGTIAREFHEIAEDMKQVKANADQVPLLKQSLETTQNLYEGINSDIKHLMRGSRPNFGSEE